MFGLITSFLFCLSVHSFNVELWGSNGDRDKFVEQLQDHGVNVNEVDKPSSLSQWGDWRVDGVIMCEGKFDNDNVVDFVNSGRSLVIFMNENLDGIGDLVREFGIEPSRKATDEEKCNYTSPTQDHKETDLTCSGYTFSLPKGHQSIHAVYYTPFVGKKGKSFVIATQGDNDARVVIFGGSAFGTEDQERDDPAAYQASLELALWAFKRTGVMRGRDLRYVRHADGEVNPPELTISDDITFSIVLETFNSETSQWVGYSADDVQVDFTMLVPRIRKTLKSYNNGTFALDFQCPDIFGVYQFIVDYHARGYTPINITHQLMLHPLHHDEHPRYVRSAYPFYYATFIMAIAVVILCVLIARTAPLFTEFPKEKEEKEEKKGKAKKE